MRYTKLRAALIALAWMFLWTLPATATYTNPAAIVANQFQPLYAHSVAVSITATAFPGAIRELSIQNQCASPVYMQANGVTAVAGTGFEIAAGAERTWPDYPGGPIPHGPYSFITASAACDPAASTGLMIFLGTTSP
jgi:hypothetical protein